MKEIVCSNFAEVAAAINGLPVDALVTVVFEEEGEEGEA